MLIIQVIRYPLSVFKVEIKTPIRMPVVKNVIIYRYLQVIVSIFVFFKIIPTINSLYL